MPCYSLVVQVLYGICKFVARTFLKKLETLLVFSTHLYVFSASEATATWRFTNFVLYCIFCTVSSKRSSIFSLCDLLIAVSTCFSGVVCASGFDAVNSGEDWSRLFASLISVKFLVVLAVRV